VATPLEGRTGALWAPRDGLIGRAPWPSRRPRKHVIYITLDRCHQNVTMHLPSVGIMPSATGNLTTSGFLMFDGGYIAIREGKPVNGRVRPVFAIRLDLVALAAYRH
jgi:hypothetical protein